MTSVDQEITQILSGFPAEQRAVLERLRKEIKALVPGATERISYAMPTFEISGEILIHFMGFDKHNSLFPGGQLTTKLAKALSDYRVSKGTIQFALDKPFPKPLLKQILKLRIEEINERYPKPNGDYRDYYDNGHLKSKGKYRDSQMHGHWQFFRRDGSLMREGKLNMGEPVGEWTTHVRP